MLPLFATITHDLVGSFATAAVGAALVFLIFRRLHWPVIFGYLLAGMLMGPHLFSHPLVSNVDAVSELSEFGVVFLLFFIGMEFDLRRLRSVMGPAAVALLAQTACMYFVASAFSDILGWNSLYTLFLASLLAISSSMVAVGVMREQHKLNLPHAQLAIGVLVLEDILAVILLVVLSGLGVTREFQWEQVWLVTAFMGLFVVVTYLIGRVSVAYLLDKLRSSANAEEYTMLSIGVALGLSLLALHLGFSLALGAFVAGAIFSQTRDVEQIEATTRSLHDVFSAVFFVSIGMLLDPLLILEDIDTVLLLSGAIILGKILSCWLGFFLGGQPSGNGFQAAVAKSQIGEFSFVIAGLGNSLGITSDRFTAVAFGTAFITILSTPFLASHSEGVYRRLERHTPRFWIQYTTAYRRFIESIFSHLGGWKALKLAKMPFMRLGAYLCMMCGLLLGGAAVCAHFHWQHSLSAIAVWAVVALFLTPLTLTSMRNANAAFLLLTEALWVAGGNRHNAYHRTRAMLTHVFVGVLLICINCAYVALASHFLRLFNALILLVIFSGVLAVLFWRQLVRFNSHLENIFRESYIGNEELEQRRKDAILKEMSARYPWPVAVREFRIPRNSGLAGRRIADLKLREEAGVTVIALARNDFRLFDPPPTSPLFPGDVLVLLGESAQIQKAFECLLAYSDREESERSRYGFKLRQIIVEAESPLDGNTLAGADLRRKQGVNVVGIQRGATRITAPGGSELLRAGDILHVVD